MKVLYLNIWVNFLSKTDIRLKKKSQSVFKNAAEGLIRL